MIKKYQAIQFDHTCLLDEAKYKGWGTIYKELENRITNGQDDVVLKLYTQLRQLKPHVMQLCHINLKKIVAHIPPKYPFMIVITLITKIRMVTK